MKILRFRFEMVLAPVMLVVSILLFDLSLEWNDKYMMGMAFILFTMIPVACITCKSIRQCLKELMED